MPVQDKIRRYHLIIEKIQKSKKPSFRDIQYFLLDHDFPISHRTLQRDIEQIKYQLNIHIEYEKQSNGYYIEEDNHSKNVLNLLQQKSLYSDLMEFTKDNPKQKEIILLDNEIHQSGFEYIQDILSAIRQQRVIEMSYQKFKNEHPKTYIIQPYALKVYENRWYIVCTLHGKVDLYKFGIERIVELKVATTKFKRDKKIAITEHFAKMIGVNDAQKNREEVQLSFSPLFSKYIETLPLHWTQKEVERTKEWITFEYYLILNFELEQKILSFGSDVIVKKPAILRRRITTILKNNLKNYT